MSDTEEKNKKLLMKKRLQQGTIFSPNIVNVKISLAASKPVPYIQASMGKRSSFIIN